MSPSIARLLSAVFWLFGYGFLIFSVAGFVVFMSFPGVYAIHAAIVAMILLTVVSFLAYSVRIKFRYQEDWEGLTPRRMAMRVFGVLINGGGSPPPK